MRLVLAMIAFEYVLSWMHASILALLVPPINMIAGKSPRRWQTMLRRTIFRAR